MLSSQKKIGTLDNKVKLLKFKKWWEGVTPHNGVHMGVFLLEEREGAEKMTKGEQRLVPGDKSGGGEKVGLGKEKDENWQDPPLQREHSERAQRCSYWL